MRWGVGAALLVGGGALGWRATYRAAPTLLSDGVALGADGTVEVLPAGAGAVYVPGTRLPAQEVGAAASTGTPAGHEALAHAALARRAGARLTAGRWAELADGALCDLLALTGPTLAWPDAARPATVFPAGAVVAAPVGYWRYTWPRDASFGAVALGAVGLGDEALAVLDHLAALQLPDGSFAARYTHSGQVPDARPAQTDGVGWFLWAAGCLAGGTLAPQGAPTGAPQGASAVGAQPGAGARSGSGAQSGSTSQSGAAARSGAGAQSGTSGLGGRLVTALGRAAACLMTRTATPSHLPAASPDYWEVRERTLTLGTAAPVLMGLEAAHALARAGLGLGLEASALGERCSRVRQAVVRNYGPTWGRYPRTDAVDAAIALVGPPFLEALPGVGAVRATARARLGRHSGGLAPGTSWRDDGVSWTPETALMALSARGWGWQGEAEELLAWLEAHRTASGALPEKVGPDGAPAGPAPLAWTDALVLLATC